MSAMTTEMAVGVPLPAGRRSPVVDDASTPLRLTRRGRVTIFVLALGVGLVGMFGSQSADAGTPAPAVPVDTYTVAAGETLWDIAVDLAGPAEDVRDVVDRLMTLNDLPSAALAAGQQILLPREA